jgi:hypothetical protein
MTTTDLSGLVALSDDMLAHSTLRNAASIYMVVPA